MSETAGIAVPSQAADGGTKVHLVEETTDTGGHFQICSIKVTMDATTGWKEKDVTFKVPISLLSSQFYTPANCDGDEVEFQVGPDTTVGTLTADASAGATVLTVQQSVIDNIAKGYYAKIADGTNTDDLGLVLDVDEVNLQITVETATTNAFLAATPSYIKQTVKPIPNKILVAGQNSTIGASKIGGSYVPANVVLKCRYNNISATARDFIFDVEYLY